MMQMLKAIDIEIVELEARLAELQGIRERLGEYGELGRHSKPSSGVPELLTPRGRVKARSLGARAVGFPVAPGEKQQRGRWPNRPANVVGMPLREFAACVLAEYPGEPWSSAELWSEVDGALPNRMAMHNAVTAATKEGWAMSPSRGVYASTKQGEQLLARHLKKGVYPLNGSSAASGAPAKARAATASATSHGLMSQAARAYGTKTLGMPFSEFVACVIADRPGETWASVALWDSVSGDISKRQSMTAGVNRALEAGWIANPSRGNYVSTKQGERLLAKHVKGGSWKKSGSVPQPPAKTLKTRGWAPKSKSKKSVRTRERLPNTVGMPYQQFVACVAAEYPGELWSPAELWGVVEGDLVKRGIMDTAITNAALAGLVERPKSGGFQSTRNGEQLLAKQIKNGIYTTKQPARDPKSSAKPKSEIKAAKSSPRRPRARTPSTSSSASSQEADSKASNTNGVVNSVEVSSHTDVAQLRALMATAPAKQWTFAELVERASIESRRVADALKGVIAAKYAEQVDRGRYVLSPSVLN
jgi:hypothetical protein